MSLKKESYRRERKGGAGGGSGRGEREGGAGGGYSCSYYLLFIVSL